MVKVTDQGSCQQVYCASLKMFETQVTLDSLYMDYE